MATKNPASMLAPGDFDVEGQALARKRKVLEALQAQQMEQTDGQMVSGHYVATSPLARIAKLAGSYFADKGLKENDAQQADLTQRYGAGLAEAAQKYMQTREGTPERVMQGQESLAGVLQMYPAVAPNPRQAMVDAMTSQFKPLQDIGKADFAAKVTRPEGMTQKERLALAANYSPESVLEFDRTQDSGVLKGKDKDQWEAPARFEGADGRPFTGQRNKTTGEVKALGSGQTINVDTKGASTLAKGVADLQVKGLAEGRDQAIGARDLYGVLQNAKQLLGTATTGFGADAVLGLQKLGALLGVPDPQGISSTEQLGSTLANNILSNVGKLKGAISDKEMPFLQAVAGGTIKADAKTLERVLNTGIAGSVNSMRLHEGYLQNLSGQEGTSPQQLSMFAVPLPELTGMTGDVYDVDERTHLFRTKPNVGEVSKKPKAGAQLHPDPVKNARMLELQKLLSGG